MNNLTTEQLTELTERVHERLNEFEMPNTMLPTKGIVRVVHDLIAEWHDGESNGFKLIRDEDGRVTEQAPWAQLVADVDAAIEPEPEHEPVQVTAPEQPHTNGNGTKPALSPQATATLGPEHTVVTPLKYAHLPTLDELVAEVKRQAMGGVMPTMAAFDMARPATWATAQAHLVRLNLTWSDLAKEADLTLKRAK
ncbi:MAG: hypothetical protein IT328_22995 [Caldilineaceae bacterium]|nr:hypothetical protein [Caldilineaceae bacterium]